MSETPVFALNSLSGAPLTQPLAAARNNFKGGALQLQEHFRSLVTAPNDHFDRLFTRDATGVIAGKSVSRDGLKAALLALNKEWSPASCRFGPATCLDGFVRPTFHVLIMASRAANSVLCRSRRTAILCRGMRASTPKSSPLPCESISRINVRALLTECMRRPTGSDQKAVRNVSAALSSMAKRVSSQIDSLAPARLRRAVHGRAPALPVWPRSSRQRTSWSCQRSPRACLCALLWSHPSASSLGHCTTQLTFASPTPFLNFQSHMLSAHAVVFCSWCLYPCTILCIPTVFVPVTSHNQYISRNWISCRGG